MLNNVNDRVTWSVDRSVGLSPSEHCRKLWSYRYTVCVPGSGGSRERADHFGRILYCVHSTQYSLL